MRYLLSLLVVISGVSFGQIEASDVNSNYESAFNQIEAMLSGRGELNFKKAVLTTEAVYLDFQIDTVAFNDAIKTLVDRCSYVLESSPLIYDRKDKDVVSKWGAIFKVMTDTITKPIGGLVIAHVPFHYDFDDFFGERDWTKMFVSKLLQTNSGNCHSLPYLYKIIAEQMGVPAHLALAPNHVYIKHRSLKTGWYNTELTSAAFPIDAWIMASGYIHLSAIQNGVYMKALTETESIALCMVDLAEGYKRRRSGTEAEFILKCCDTALKYFPNYINALLLKAETLKSRYEEMVMNSPAPSEERKRLIKQTFKDMQDLYVHIHELGYRQMPKSMYLQWLTELKVEKEKYQNKGVMSFAK